MRRRTALVFILLTGCGKSPQSDIQYIKQARSIAAEWALVNEQASAGQITAIYASSMHRWLHDELRTASKSLSQPHSRYGLEIRVLLAEPKDTSPDRLQRHAAQLKQIESHLESA